MFNLPRAFWGLAALVLLLGISTGCGQDTERSERPELIASTPPKTQTEAKTASEPTRTATSSDDVGIIDPAKCFADAGAKTVSSKDDLPALDPSNIVVEASGTTRTGKHPIAFKNVEGRPVRVYMVGGHRAAASVKALRKSESLALAHPERLSYVGVIAPASPKEIAAGKDCL